MVCQSVTSTHFFRRLNCGKSTMVLQRWNELKASLAVVSQLSSIFSKLFTLFDGTYCNTA